LYFYAEALRVKFEMEITMRQSDNTFDSSQLEYEAWRDLLRSKGGRHYSEGIKPSAFTGRPVKVRGFTALDIGCDARRVEPTYRDVRLDGADHYFALFQVADNWL
jgi:AraC family transcriptional regulator, positive regulator of tynA and feaB